jgi:hypothetical protein
MSNLTPDETRELARLLLETVPEEVTCDQWAEFAAGYADHLARGAEVPEPLRRVAQHLRVCPACSEELRVSLQAILADAAGEP